MADVRFGFGGRLAESFPSQVILDVTEVCNLACVHCPHPEFKAGPLYGGRHLDVELAAKAIAEVAENRRVVQYVRVSANGEPLVHPGIFDILGDAVARGGVPVTLTTNGTLLDAARAEKVLACGVEMVDISIDAVTPETYAKVRKGKLALTRANVRGLIARKRATGAATRVVVSYVEQEENRAETSEFVRFWEGEGADRVIVRRLHSNAGASAGIAEGLEDGGARYPCLYPWERVLLNARGMLAYCPQDWVHGSELADYRQASIAQVWTGDAYRKLRAAHSACSFGAGHEFCGRCPDWRTTRWPHQEGRAYADLVSELKRS